MHRIHSALWTGWVHGGLSVEGVNDQGALWGLEANGACQTPYWQDQRPGHASPWVRTQLPLLIPFSCMQALGGGGDESDNWVPNHREIWIEFQALASAQAQSQLLWAFGEQPGGQGLSKLSRNQMLRCGYCSGTGQERAPGHRRGQFTSST